MIVRAFSHREKVAEGRMRDPSPGAPAGWLSRHPLPVGEGLLPLLQFRESFLDFVESFIFLRKRKSNVTASQQRV